MKKNLFLKYNLLLLAFAIIFVSLTGCDLFSKNDVVRNNKDTSQTQFYGEVKCYREPSFDAEILYTFSDGLSADPISTTVRDNITWVKTEYGWIPLTGNNASVSINSQVERVEFSDLDDEVPEQIGFVTGVNLRVRSGPGAENEKVAELAAGTKVTLTEFYEASDGTWGKMEQGWIFMEHVYLPGTETQRHGYAVAKQDATIYDAILQPRNSIRTVVIGERLEIMHYITFEGDERWGYTNSGWIDLRGFYVEGEVGLKPASGIVQDTTPLNVRLGPGIQYQILSTLENGVFVSVSEQITCNSDTWGYTGYGWIAMSRVVKSNDANQTLVGKWKYVGRSSRDGVDIATGDVWIFRDNGTYSWITCGGSYYFDENGQLQDAPGYGMGSQEFSGTYRYNGAQLELTCTYIEHEPGVALPYYSSLNVRVDNGVPCLYFDGSNDRYYRVNENDSLLDIVTRYGI